MIVARVSSTRAVSASICSLARWARASTASARMQWRRSVRTCLGLALQPVMRGTGFGIGGAFTVDGTAQFVQLRLQRVDTGSSASALAVSNVARFGECLLDAALGLVERTRLEPLRHLAFMRDQRPAVKSMAETAERWPSRVSRSVLTAASGPRGRHRTGLGEFRRLDRLCHFNFERGKPVAFRQPLGCGEHIGSRENPSATRRPRAKQGAARA
jgi:hypothetical protein